jgi:hypothetical protein
MRRSPSKLSPDPNKDIRYKTAPQEHGLDSYARVRWSRHEILQHEQFIESLMLRNVSDRNIEKLCLSELGVHAPRCRKLRVRILERWKIAGAQEAETNRVFAIRRIKKNIADVHAEFAEQKLTPAAKHQALSRYESLLVPLEGTSQPIKIEHDVTVSVNLQGVIANLTPEQTQKYIERRKAMELEALEYRRLHGGNDQAAE